MNILYIFFAYHYLCIVLRRHRYKNRTFYLSETLGQSHFCVKGVQKVFHSFLFPKLDIHYVKVLNCIHLQPWS